MRKSFDARLGIEVQHLRTTMRHLVQTSETLSFLSLEQAEAISCQTERDFALKCLAVGCLLVYQVPVDGSQIDFLVINPKVQRNLAENTQNKGTLVEVTLLRKEDKDKTMREKSIKGKKKRSPNKTGLRKNRQIQAMMSSGYRWTILYKENIRKMMGITTKSISA